MSELYTEKNKLYNDFHGAKNELKELEIIKKNVDTLLGKMPEKDNKSKAKSQELDF